MRRTCAIESMESRCMLSVVPTFAADANFYTGKTPVAVATGDFNRDNNLDFVTVDADAGTITIRRGRGDGTFRPATSIAVGSDPRDIAVADFNKDGKLDLAVLLRGENAVVSYKGDGAGGFTLAGRVGAGNLAFNPNFFTAAKLATGDFDGDGKLDLAVTNNGDESISVLRGKGTGAFYYRVTTHIPEEPVLANTQFSPLAFVASDLNNDGKTDLVVVGSNSTIDVLRATSGGHFSLLQQISHNDSNTSDPRDGVLTDVNGDKILDLAIASGGTDGVVVRLGTGGGIFAAENTYGVSQWPVGLDRGPIGIVAADFNKDGAIDLATANVNAGTRTVLVNSGTGTFPQRTEQPFLDDGEPPVLSPYIPVELAAGDFNNDGKADLVVVNRNLNNVTVLLNTTPTVI